MIPHIHDVNLSLQPHPKGAWWIGDLGDCGGHLSKVNHCHVQETSLKMIWALWHDALSCWKYIRRWYTVVIKGWTWSPTILRLWRLNQSEPLRQGRMIHAFMFFTPNTDSTSECCSRNRDSSDQATFFQSSIVQFWLSLCELYPPCACSYLTGAAPGVVFCCWSPSASGFEVLCVQRMYSADLG